MSNNDHEGRPQRRLIYIGIPIVVVVLLVAAVTVLVIKSRVDATTVAAAATSSVPTATTVPTVGSLAPVPTTTTTPPPPPDPLAPGAAQAAVSAVDAESGSSVKFGVAVLDRATGQETDGANAGTQFYCASVLKLFLITDLLHRQEQGRLTLSTADLSNIHLALTISKDSAMDSLWGKYGGAAAVTELVGLAHLRDTVVTSVARGGLWGGVLISARDVVAVYEYDLTQLTPADRDLILTNLNQAKPIGDPDFDQAFGLLGPTRNAATKAKQGWMTYGHEVMLHTTGIPDTSDQVVVAILSERSGSSAQFPLARQQQDTATAALLKALGPQATT